MWPFSKPKNVRSVAPIFFTNTLSGTKELFVPRNPGVVSLYSCGPTVYGPQHIGNLRAALFSDVIARVLMAAGYHVRRVTNITDVGHLVGDGDEGDDKMAVGALREHVSPAAIAERYTTQYIEDSAALNINTKDIHFPKATEYIQEQIAMIGTLEEKGFAYRCDDGVYFDTSKLPSYGKLGGVATVKLMGGARIKIEGGKRNLHDFALWRAAKPGDLQKWDSPWGPGNPGWHIECSAMIRALLGTSIDIHTGGMDHIPVHHNNEIAQSETVTGKPLARYWLHEAFITIEGEKISKSLGNEVLLADIVARGFHPLALRYFYLQASFRTPVSFSWEALGAAHEALQRLWRLAAQVIDESDATPVSSDAELRMIATLRDDLATPAALALLWETLRHDTLSMAQKYAVLAAGDAVLGLSLLAPPAQTELPSELATLLEDYEQARVAKNYEVSDRIRQDFKNRGYRVDDGPSGTIVTVLPR